MRTGREERSLLYKNKDRRAHSLDYPLVTKSPIVRPASTIDKRKFTITMLPQFFIFSLFFPPLPSPPLLRVPA